MTQDTYYSTIAYFLSIALPFVWGNLLSKIYLVSFSEKFMTAYELWTKRSFGHIIGSIYHLWIGVKYEKQ